MADKFADIAKINSNRKKLLKEQQPEGFCEKTCALMPSDQMPFKTEKRISTKEELTEALAKMRAEYKKYLADYAPALPMYTKRIYVQNFLSEGKTVRIPDYGAPIGYASKEYEADFEMDAIEADKAVFLHFESVDYIAVVYVNDVFVGTHEGFFSPFSFPVTNVIKKGKNKLRVVVQNDFCYMGNSVEADESNNIEGDKLYAATGMGFDDPYTGWHHCPPGMGICGNVYLEIRNKISITDLYVRPLPETCEAEAWIEIENVDHTNRDVEFILSLYGQNFEQTIFENYKYKPLFAKVHAEDIYKTQINQYETDISGASLKAKFGKNTYKIRFSVENPKLWTPETPYLYQLQVMALEGAEITDSAKCQFGMRSFSQDVETDPKGMFYLNGEKIMLRGANTMGFEQQDVLRNDFDQLIDDILLAKICHINFWRLTQRPVQDEIYTYCDKLGLLTQTDLPLFGVMRNSKVPEAIRQTEEMIRLVRKHPCNILISYINEPMPNSYENPHRYLGRSDLERFFSACDMVAEIHCPEIVTKHADGDYDPPAVDSMPDNHCYTLWYNNHAVEFRKLHKGYWTYAVDGWCFGCGEFGAEGLDFKEIMEEYYPKEWYREPFAPENIMLAQSGDMQPFFFDKPDSLDAWIYETQKHQAFSTRYVTEAFRRNNKMVSIAIHLFIDAWPAGWMKAIMDCKRNPKPAYFAYKNALEPVMLSIRSDRFTFFSGENAHIEFYICNDTSQEIADAKIIMELYKDGKMLLRGEEDAHCAPCHASYSVSAAFTVPQVADREGLTLKGILVDAAGNEITHNTWDFEAFSDVALPPCRDDIVFITDLEAGEHIIAGEKVTVQNTSNRNYVCAQTNHPAVREFKDNDFRFWYDKETDMLQVMTNKVFTAEGFTPIITAVEGKEPMLVVAEKIYENKKYIISAMKINCENPVAKRFLKNLYA